MTLHQDQQEWNSRRVEPVWGRDECVVMLWARSDGGLPARGPPGAPPGAPPPGGRLRGVAPGVPASRPCTEALVRDLRALKARAVAKARWGSKSPKGCIAFPKGLPRGLRGLPTAPLVHAYARWRGRRVAPTACTR